MRAHRRRVRERQGRQGPGVPAVPRAFPGQEVIEDRHRVRQPPQLDMAESVVPAEVLVGVMPRPPDRVLARALPVCDQLGCLLEQPPRVGLFAEPR
jgi:hypothetical protein